MKASREFISDLARKALNGNQAAFKFLMNVLEDTGHPVLAEIDRRYSGSVLAPLSKLVEGYPKPVVHSQSLVWNSASGRPHNENFPAELGFREPYVAYFKGGERHRDGASPAVVDVSNKTIAYYTHGEPRRHSKGPFKVEQDLGQIMLTYVMDDRMTTPRGYTGLDSRGDPKTDPEFEEPVEGGAHVIITKDFVDIEGLGRSDPSEDDLRNLGIWRKELFKWLDWGSTYIHGYLNTFK